MVGLLIEQLQFCCNRLLPKVFTGTVYKMKLFIFYQVLGNKKWLTQKYLFNLGQLKYFV